MIRRVYVVEEVKECARASDEKDIASARGKVVAIVPSSPVARATRCPSAERTITLLSLASMRGDRVIREIRMSS